MIYEVRLRDCRVKTVIGNFITYVLAKNDMEASTLATEIAEELKGELRSVVAKPEIIIGLHSGPRPWSSPRIDKLLQEFRHVPKNQ